MVAGLGAPATDPEGLATRSGWHGRGPAAVRARRRCRASSWSPVGRRLDLDARRVGSLAHDAIRIEAGEPVMGIDLDEATIPQEADVVDGAVDFTKGCYLGQELVARIDSRGHVNRRLRGLTVDHQRPAPARRHARCLRRR